MLYTPLSDTYKIPHMLRRNTRRMTVVIFSWYLVFIPFSHGVPRGSPSVYGEHPTFINFITL